MLSVASDEDTQFSIASAEDVVVADTDEPDAAAFYVFEQ